MEFFNPVEFNPSDHNFDSTMRDQLVRKEMRIPNYFHKQNKSISGSQYQMGLFAKEESFVNLNSSVEVSLDDKADWERLSNNTESSYSNPGKILNVQISEYNPVTEAMSLKLSLKEIYDYVVIHPKGWEYLSSWYEFDHPVYVRVIKSE